jgi:hypothetical protein
MLLAQRTLLDMCMRLAPGLLEYTLKRVMHMANDFRVHEQHFARLAKPILIEDR